MRSCVVGQKKIILPGELALLFIIREYEKISVNKILL